MNEKRKYEFYEIRKRGDIHFITRANEYVGIMRCKEIVQCGTAIAAKQKNGLYKIYAIQVKTFSRIGIVCVMDNVEEFYYTKRLYGGLLLLKVVTGKNCGYWTAFDEQYFNTTKEEEKARQHNLFQIPYTGISKARIIDGFDYLKDDFLIEVDGTVYWIFGSHMQALGNVKVEPLPFDGIFKMISEEGESFISDNSFYRRVPVFGPFYKITNKDFGKEYPICYFAYDEQNNIVGMYYKRFKEGESKSKKMTNIIFNPPVKQVSPIERIFTFEGSVASWRLLYEDGTIKILICSIADSNDISITLNVSHYI